MKRSVLLLGAWFALAVGGAAGALEPSDFPSLMSSARIAGPLDFCGEPVPLDTSEVLERMEKELLLALWNRPQVVLWIKRSARYLPLIEKHLASHRMPGDLKYVPLIESALRPHAGSSKGAVGYWQFMPETARKYGLTVNPDIDERRNVLPSTRGAIEYFKALFTRFGSWTLAAAAFNMGEEGLASEMLAQAAESFYDLYLPLETQRYIFRILSAKLILSDPATYGFRFTPQDLYPPLQYDRIFLQLTEEIPVLLIAQAAGTGFKQIKDLNPEIRGHYLAAGKRFLMIPKGASKEFHLRLDRLVGARKKNMEKRIYIVQKGDNLSSIADRFNVPLPALLIWNRLDPTRPIHPEDRLVIAPGHNTENP